MELATMYHLPSLFQIAFLALIEIPLTQLTKGQRKMIGVEIFSNVALAKARLNRHHQIVTAEEPHIPSHVDNCQDPSACEADWHGIWWNSMGHYLLDGCNPQTYDEAIKHFKMMKFGHVSRGYKEKMFQLLDDGAPFKYVEHFIDELCDYLVIELRI